MVLWEAVLSPALQVLFEKLASGDVLRRFGINGLLLEKLKIAYFANAAMLDDAEMKQYDDPAIETWLDMLKNAVYEAEDTLDELATEALRSNQARNWNFLGTNFSPFCEEINSRIENLIEKLEYIGKQKDFLGLKSGLNGRRGAIKRSPTTPLLIESRVHGRTSEKEDILRLLLADENGIVLPSVIPILGMGGIGKTTLAQIVYNDRRVDEVFDIKSWAHVSDDFSLTRVTKSLLESATGKPCDTTNLELLQSRLKDVFNKKKFLVVLDDVWNEKHDDWNDLSIPFMVGSKGSRIVVTTRNQGVVSSMDSLLPYRLMEMSDDACWSLMVHHAFGVGGLGTNSSLSVIGREIVKKCKGLPLAVKTLGSVLASKLKNDHWNEILNSKLWDITPKKNGILPSLRLSYHHLPSNLKRCFSYCSIFPKGHEFNKKNLILLWMAEGFVQPMGKMTLEDVGEEYFSELLSRSFFQETVQDKTRYVMHDLLNDLAQSVSRKMCVHLENWEKGWHENLEKVRHFSCFRSKYDVYKKFEPLSEAKWLRTFLPFSSPIGDEFCYLTKKVPRYLLPKFLCLRVLSLYGYRITELPDSIGNLKHLRYINLSYTEIRSLPQTLTTLFNLQSLLLSNCDYLSELPADMGNLVNLRYLDINGSGIQKMPLDLGNLVNLRMLPRFIVCSSGSNIGDLRSLSHLQESLWISSLEKVASSWDARRSNLHEKKGLNRVAFEWSTNVDGSLSGNATDTLEMLQPHSNLEKVKIKNYPGKKFPSWIVDRNFSKLVSLSLIECKRCEFLPPIGELPSLKEFYMKGMLGLRRIGVEFYGFRDSPFTSFASLEKLSFVEMLEWEEWSYDDGGRDIEAFPALLELHVEQCPKLQGKLPCHLSSLTKLVIRECEHLSSSLPRITQILEMEIRRSNSVLFSSNLVTNLLTSLEIQNMRGLMYLPEEWLQHLKRLERLVISDCFELVYLARNMSGLQNLISLRILVVRGCPLMISLCEEFIQQLPQKLEYMELECCHSLERLPHELGNLGSLQELVITDCPNLELLSGTTVFPPNLQGLVLRGCSLESLPESMINISSLKYVYISGCLVLTSFPGDKKVTTTTFKQLTIDHCPHLEFLPQGIMHNNNTFLELLEIFDCSSIMSFPPGQLPKTLKTLTFWNCSNLESLADVIIETISLESLRIGNCTNLKHLPSGLHKLVYLDYLQVDGCPSIEFFPEEGLPSARLRKMQILNCDNLKLLSKSMQSLTSLQELEISNCPLIESFPQDCLPINLVSLDIKEIVNIKPCSEWGLHRLTSLKKLRIHGCRLNIDTFPEWLLPSTLETLHIVKQPTLESLSPWLKNLTSLEKLKIEECSKILSFPSEGMPPMVSLLEISGCPQLQLTYEKELPSIDHIPCIVM